MAEYEYTIRLTSDAEPGTGLGGETVNQFVPKSSDGDWVLYGSHIKGLMRQALRDVIATQSSKNHWTPELIYSTFGEGDDVEVGTESQIRVIDAVAAVNGEEHDGPLAGQESKFVTRTAIGSDGVATAATLRTTESVPEGTEFKGKLYSHADVDSPEGLAWRLALVSIPAVGGNRNRGSGTCVGGLVNEDLDKPSVLLAKLDETLQKTAPKRATLVHEAGKDLPADSVVLRLTFEAIQPLCCPEITDKTNVIQSGFSIPASAVQGAILHRLNRANPELATATFEHAMFRAWPLQPVAHPNDTEASKWRAIRVSCTHRASKFFQNDQSTLDDFQDEAIQPYRWPTTTHGAPLKASDGVLLFDGAGNVRLWRARSMPHVITSHGVHHDEIRQELEGTSRNLFTVDSMAPMTWQGLLSMPAEAADELVSEVGKDPIIAFGKSRSVRGAGKLKAEVLDGVPPEWKTPGGERTVLVVQSPILLNRDAKGSADEEFEAMAQEWVQNSLPGHDLGFPTGDGRPVWANIGIRFGWRRHQIGKQKGGLLNAERVILPGSVISLSKPVDEEILSNAIQRGFSVGDPEDDRGRQMGFGAVCVHPGRAQDLYKFERKKITKGSPLKDAMETIVKLQQFELPSPSQIRAVKSRIERTGTVEAGIKYLEEQLERTTRVWFAWESIQEQVGELLKMHLKQPQVAIRALEVLADLSSVRERKD